MNAAIEELPASDRPPGLEVIQQLAIHADSDMMTEEGSLDYNKLKPFVYNQGEYWSLGKKIGYYGCSAK